MQDVQPLHGRIFCGGDRAELRRIVGYQSVAARQQQPPPPAKCPRCDSTNTKFCYYNNYNLSQPRHFCKSCRRYWTKGGVLRNVPVGGGCRKSKRPSPKTSSKPPPESADNDQSGRHPPHSSSLCSRDSASISDARTASLLPDPSLLANQISISDPNPNFDPLPDVDPPPHPEPYIFQVPVGAFTETPAARLGFGLHDAPPGQEKVEAIKPAFADQTVPVDARPAEGGDTGHAPLDLSGHVEPTLYDLTCVVDPLSYWNQSHWSDEEPSLLYLP